MAWFGEFLLVAFTTVGMTCDKQIVYFSVLFFHYYYVIMTMMIMIVFSLNKLAACVLGVVVVMVMPLSVVWWMRLSIINITISRGLAGWNTM